MDLWIHIKWINHTYHIVLWYIYHIYLYQYFLKVKPPRKSFFVFHPCCHGASFQFLFLCGAVGDSEAFAVCDEFAHEFVYPKSQDHGRNTWFFFTKKYTHTRNGVVSLFLKKQREKFFKFWIFSLSHKNAHAVMTTKRSLGSRRRMNLIDSELFV